MKNETDKFITKKLFRKRENLNKVNYIIEHSDITYDMIYRAAIIANKNPYHNFGHMLGFTESAIMILIAEGAERKEINRVAMSGLTHDAGHEGRVRVYDEIRSFELTSLVYDEDDLKIMGMTKDQAMAAARDDIFATIFGNRGKINDRFARVMQDADLAHLGRGAMYWLWASMGLVDEFAAEGRIFSPTQFIYEEQPKFISFLKTRSQNNDKVYLSEGAQNVFVNPEESLRTLVTFKPAAIEYAYNVRREDIILDEFKTEVERLNAIA